MFLDTIPLAHTQPQRSCAVCGSLQRRLLFEQNFSQISNGGSLLSGYHVVVCANCGFCFADYIPEQSAFDAYYRDMSKYEQIERGGQDSLYEQARFRAVAKAVVKHLPSSQVRICEIGCANGQLLALLKDQGFKNVLGIDPSPVCAQTAERLYGIHVLTNTLSNVSLETQAADFLILTGVLEHVRELHAAVQRLWEMLPLGGRVFLAVPDASRYVDGEDAPFQEFSVEHINFFGPESLNNLMYTAKFELVSFEQELLETNYRTTTPIIYGTYQKNNTPMPWTQDTHTEKGLMAYIRKSHQGNDLIRQSISRIVSTRQPIVIWGTGAHTLRLLAASQLGDANIRAFVDSNPKYQGKELNGIPIISPQALDKNSGAIMISSRVYQHEIEEQIRNNLHLDNQIITLYPMD